MSYAPQHPEKSHGNGQMAMQQPMEYQPQPGGHPHPVQHSNNWTYGFWDCFRPCNIFCTAYWCPCILFGRTEARMRNEDPAAAGTCNGPCAIYCGLLACTGLQCVYQAIRRGDKKDRWGISEGGGFGDWCGAWCCPVCGLVQEEKEALLRQNGVQAVPPKGYEKQEGMQYGQGGSA